MLIPSHWALSGKLYRLAKKETGFAAFSKWALHWGSIRPDVHSPFRRGNHKYHLSMDQVEELWNSLEELPAFRRFTYSYRLGVVLHYLADFFCWPHNDPYYDTHLKEHFDYEKALHRYIVACADPECDGGRPSELRLYLDQQRAKYLRQEASMDTDTQFISECAWTLVQWAILMNQKRELAVA